MYFAECSLNPQIVVKHDQLQASFGASEDGHDGRTVISTNQIGEFMHGRKAAEHAWALAVSVQGIFREHSGNGERSGNIQGTFRTVISTNQIGEFTHGRKAAEHA